MVKNWRSWCVVCTFNLFALQLTGASPQQSAAEYLKNNPQCGFKNAQEVIRHVAMLNPSKTLTADDIEQYMGRGPQTTELSVFQHIQWWTVRTLPVLGVLSLLAALGIWYLQIEWRELLPYRLS